MFNWFRINRNLRAQVAEMQAVIDNQQHLLGVRLKMVEQKTAEIEGWCVFGKNIALALGQTGTGWSKEKLYLIKFLNVYYKWKDVAEIVNAIYQANHSPDTVRKAAKRGAK